MSRKRLRPSRVVAPARNDHHRVAVVRGGRACPGCTGASALTMRSISSPSGAEVPLARDRLLRRRRSSPPAPGPSSVGNVPPSTGRSGLISSLKATRHGGDRLGHAAVDRPSRRVGDEPVEVDRHPVAGDLDAHAAPGPARRRRRRCPGIPRPRRLPSGIAATASRSSCSDLRGDLPRVPASTSSSRSGRGSPATAPRRCGRRRSARSGRRSTSSRSGCCGGAGR